MVSILPKISIITPSFNQGRYIEETIVSVVGQMYPNLEYFIIDGGSTDNSVDIIRKYEQHITYWESKADRGQSHAINKGFRMATGDIIAWINSDDCYLPGTLQFVASTMNGLDRTILFGNSIHTHEQTTEIIGSNVARRFSALELTIGDTIIQPSSFWDRATLEEVGPLNEEMHYAFDWEWFIRAKLSQKVTFMPVDRYLSIYRKTATHKSATGGSVRNKEITNIYKEYSNRSVYWANSYITRNIVRVKKFDKYMGWIRPYKLRILLFKLLFFKVAFINYRYVRIFIGNVK